MTMSPALHAERSLPCTYCGAKAGEPCRTKSGLRRSWHHSARWYAAKEAGLLPTPREL